jgi:hypothetical protein
MAVESDEGRRRRPRTSKAADASFDLVVSATAFHWVDPEVKYDKAARRLGRGGWLALLATGEKK